MARPPRVARGGHGRGRRGRGEHGPGGGASPRAPGRETGHVVRNIARDTPSDEESSRGGAPRRRAGVGAGGGGGTGGGGSSGARNGGPAAHLFLFIPFPKNILIVLTRFISASTPPCPPDPPPPRPPARSPSDVLLLLQLFLLLIPRPPPCPPTAPPPCPMAPILLLTLRLGTGAGHPVFASRGSLCLRQWTKARFEEGKSTGCPVD